MENLCTPSPRSRRPKRSEEHTSELQSQSNLVCRLLLDNKTPPHPPPPLPPAPPPPARQPPPPRPRPPNVSHGPAAVARPPHRHRHHDDAGRTDKRRSGR